MRYGMVIDLKKCMGCQTCATSCKLSNNLPAGTWWNTVYTEGMGTIDTAAGDYPNCTLQHWPVACQHCAKPECVAVCPTGASHVDEETGIVLIDNTICIGCKSCVEACPYGVRSYNDGEPKYAVEFAVGCQNAPTHVANTMEKCNLCKHLIEQDKQPMCVDACVGKARYFGDFDDPESEVSKLIAGDREVVRILEEKGTEPSVYYLK